MNSDVKRFAYAACLPDGTRAGGIAILNTLVSAGFTADTTSGGKVMTMATATNKSFSYQMPAGYGPKEIGSMVFDALRLLTALTDENYLETLLAMPQSASLVRFC